MKCTKCDQNCIAVIKEEKKFCSDCGCSYLNHVNNVFFNERCYEIINEICLIDKSKSTERSVEEAAKLAKTFGTVWLPLGIQPSEVDRYLKYFPTNTDIRRSMFMKSDKRILEIQLQLPIHDRSIDKLCFTIEESSILRATQFFEKRRKEICDVARIDHLDRSEGNTCSECFESMGFGEVCVMLPKNKNMVSEVWHPHCFKCIKCRNILMDYIFCWDTKDDNGPYCLRHFDDKYNARCVNCDEMIFDEQYVSIFDESYHYQHFRCNFCDSNIAETQFVLDSDISKSQRFWKCLNCLKETNDTACLICRETIELIDPSVTMDGAMVHESCVKCRICSIKLSLTNDSLYSKKENFLYCTNCSSLKNEDSCTNCNESIQPDKDSVVSHGVFTWHKHCVECVKCHKDLSTDKEFIVINEPNNISRSMKSMDCKKFTICKECFIEHHVDICGLCNKRLEKTGVKYKSKMFHKACFVCYHCKNELNPSMFATKKEDAFCLSCYGTMFCEKCSYCMTPILGYEANEKMISFENRHWHEKCFMCTLCHKSLIEAGFLFDNEKIICVECDVK